MNFTSLSFVIFLPVVLVLYRILKKDCRLPLLLSASYFFYACHDVRLLALILITTFVSYYSALVMEKEEDKKKRKTVVRITAIICLGILFFFKYFTFALHGLLSIPELFSVSNTFESFDILLPMGISFYIFQTMSYSFDVYRRKIPAEKNLGLYALFVVFFPQLVAGPIERPGNLLPQLKEAPTPSLFDCQNGLLLLLRGYAKKILLADFFSGFVSTAYNHPNTSGGAALAAATILFAIQIYCDFSGYSDIALGCADFMGIKLSQNFNSPYTAVSIRDFWKRWHISLTRWFTDYLYIPLGGNQRGLFFQCRNILITFLASGLWHGASLTYVVWGGIHGIYLVMETIFIKISKSIGTTVGLPLNPVNAPAFSFLKRCCTFFLVCFAWIFFRASTLNHAFSIVLSIFTDFRPQQLFTGLGMNLLEFVLILILLILLPLLERLPPIRFTDTYAESKQIFTLVLYVLLAFSMIICRCYVLISNGSTSFIYFQF